MSRVKEFALPDLGEGLTEGEILKWLVSVGDTIELNQPIVEVETAKAAVEIPAKWAGKIAAIFAAEGATVAVGAPIIAIDTAPDSGPPVAQPGAAQPGAASTPPTVPAADGATREPGQTGAGQTGGNLTGGPAPGGRTAVLVGYGPRTGEVKRRPRKNAPGQPTVGADGATNRGAADLSTRSARPDRPGGPNGSAGDDNPGATRDGAGAAAGAGPVLCKPPVRKLAKDLGVDLRSLVGTGPQGSITRDDVHGAMAARPTVERFLGTGREQRVPVKGVRRLTAENMVHSAFTAPHATEFLTVDMTRAMKALDRLRARPEWQDVRISPLLVVAKAVLLAVRRHPMVNSTWAGDEIIVKEYVNLGVAAATERGLLVPNIKNAERLSSRELADALTALAQTAKAGKTAPADMSGGTLTITNVGVFGVDSGTPILPPGESAILALGAVRPMPWVHRDKVRIRQVTTLALSFDHRVIDGELASRFLRDVGDFLTDPEVALFAWG